MQVIEIFAKAFIILNSALWAFFAIASRFRPNAVLRLFSNRTQFEDSAIEITKRLGLVYVIGGVFGVGVLLANDAMLYKFYYSTMCIYHLSLCQLFPGSAGFWKKKIITQNLPAAALIWIANFRLSPQALF